MNGKFFDFNDIQLILQRAFGNITHCFSYASNKDIKGVVLNDKDTVCSITVNGVEIINPRSILLINDGCYLIEIFSIKAAGQSSQVKLVLTQTFPLNGIWQFGVCQMAKPPSTDHHGDKED